MANEKRVRCNGCGYIGTESEFGHDRDFMQNRFIASCAKKCGNRQSPGDASMRMFGGQPHPFEFVNEDGKTAKELLAENNVALNPVEQVMLDAGGAS